MMMDGSYMKGFLASVVTQVGARKGYYFNKLKYNLLRGMKKKKNKS